MIFDLWPLPKAPGEGDPKNGAGACAIHVSNSRIKSGWIPKKKILTPQTPYGTPKSDQMKIPSDMFYIFHVWEDTQSLVKKSLKLTL